MYPDEFKHLTRHPNRKGFIIDPSAAARVKDIDQKEGIVRGYYASFGNVDSYRDVIPKGAFAKTIRERGPQGADRIHHLLNHDWTHRVGRVLELEEDAHGLLFTTKLMKEHSKGRDALIEYEAGVLREHSIGFDIIKWERDTDEDILLLTEIKLWEGSGVTWGANEQTPTIDVKALQNSAQAFERMVLQLQAMKSALKGGISDARGKEFETEIGRFERALGQLKSALQMGEPEPPAGTQEPREPQTKDEIQLAILKQLQI